MSKLNMYFFGEEEVSLSDALYFYGTQVAILALVAISAAITLIN